MGWAELRERAADLLGEYADQLAATTWAAAGRHPPDASCWCIVMDALAEMIELGYTIIPPVADQTTIKQEGAPREP